MHTFLDDFQQYGKYSSQIAIHQIELRREEIMIDIKTLSISAFQIEYLNMKNLGRNIDRA